MLVRDKVFDDRTVVLTSATLELGGTFDAVAGTIGLRGEGAPAWRGLDVGSPFDYPKQGIAYVARHLPPPGPRRHGAAERSTRSRRSSGPPGAHPRAVLLDAGRPGAPPRRCASPASEDRHPVLCQGEDQIATLVRRVRPGPAHLPVRHPHRCGRASTSPARPASSSSSTGSRSRGPTTRSPRPARRRSPGWAATASWRSRPPTPPCGSPRAPAGSSAAATTAGVVAFLDSRMMTARYAGFLQRSLPPFWPTTDRAMVLAALRPARRDGGAAGARRRAGAARAHRGRRRDARPRRPPVAGLADAGGRWPRRPPPARVARTAVTSGHAWTTEEDEELRDGAELGLAARRARRVHGAGAGGPRGAARPGWASRPVAGPRSPSTEPRVAGRRVRPRRRARGGAARRPSRGGR